MSYTIEKVRAALGQINDVVPEQQPRGFSILLNQIFDNSDPDDLAENLAAIAEALLRESVGVLEAGPILTTLVARFATLSTAAQVEAGPPLLELVTPRAASFAEQDLALTRAVADALERRGRFAAAAEVLQRIDVERAGPDGDAPSADDRARHYIRIVRCYLEEDGAAEGAALWINRVKAVMYAVADPELRLMFLLCQARVLDSQRAFLEASAKYYETSLEENLVEEERLRALSQAIVCGVLSPAGPLREGPLGTLYRDERSRGLPEYPIFEKVYNNRMLSKEEVDGFADKVSPHHLAVTRDGTVLQLAALEHNCFVVSRLYCNIYTKQLDKLLGTRYRQAERAVARMMEQNRVLGYIDQVKGIIVFDNDLERRLKGNIGSAEIAWDDNVERLGQRVEAVSTMILESQKVGSSESIGHR
jgi:COP9 signalosome complex subunit 4